MAISTLTYKIWHDNDYLRLEIAGPCLRVSRKVMIPFSRWNGCEYQMAALAEDLQRKIYRKCEFGTHILGDVEVDPNPPLTRDVEGPILTLLNHRIRLHLRYAEDRDFAVGLLAQLAREISSVRAITLQDVQRLTLPEVPPPMEVREVDAMIVIKGMPPTEEFKIPKRYVGSLVSSLYRVYRLKTNDPQFRMEISLGPVETLTVKQKRYRYINVSYNSQQASFSISFSLDEVPLLISRIGYYDSAGFINTSELKHVDTDLEERSDPQCSLITSHSAECRTLMTRHTCAFFRAFELRGCGPDLRTMLSMLNSMDLYKMIIKFGYNAPPFLELDPNPDATMYSGPILKFGKYAFYNITEDSNYPHTLLRNLIEIADNVPSRGNVVAIRDRPEISITANDRNFSLIFHDGRCVEGIPIEFLTSEVFIKEKYLLPVLLEQDIDLAFWRSKAVIDKISGPEGDLILRTTGNYREVALVYIGRGGIWHIVLATHYLYPFLKNISNRSQQAPRISLEELMQIKRAIEFVFPRIKPCLKPDKTNDITEGLIKRWEDLDASEKAQFFMCLVTAPDVIREVATKLTPAD